ncbi:SpaA isopeptide-forming pilin-related protein [Bifidobacterium avesanii]|uniref:LPXTG cell wall anchor domain-containing protein n=1 Tax=Bifidobacterium avesanii TaxID=1798157 RepID=A0A7K3TJL0_9BIFI|nr:SpaA isopeptide-forming pilin-related protein [Bifidobacterium avesanii]KAB8287559.1 hypothetical protein DSM100685_1890 [Bifidobacterium avesanii]NEG79308.1 LPXTG cell wall anchor domain-containing protein [Bifidobacterium avesanii]
MKLRKLMAGLAAAATLFGGLAFGATTANAAPADGARIAQTDINNGTITLKSTNKQNFLKKADANGDQAVRDFKYVELASYEIVANNLTLVTSTDANVVTAVNAGITAAKAADTQHGTGAVIGDPMAWFAQQGFDAAALQAFNTAVRRSLTDNGFTVATNLTVTDPDAQDTNKEYSLDFGTLAGPGLYLIIDPTTKDDYPSTSETTTDQNGNSTTTVITYGALANILIGTAAGDPFTTQTGTVYIDGKPTDVPSGYAETKTNLQPESTTTGGFEVQKNDASGKGLAGATFQVKNGSTVVKFTKGADGATYTYAADQSATENVVIDIVTPAGGLLKFRNLPAGTYTVTETKAPSGFLSNIAGVSVLPSFTVTINDQGQLSDWKKNDAQGLLTLPGAGSSTVTVVNVQNITQLPHTGAAGIAMFTVIGLLLAGAAGTVYVKSRKANALLRA